MIKSVFLVVMAVLYVVAGVNHFINPQFYAKLMPAFLPAPMTLIYLSGVAEIVLGVGLLVPLIRPYAAWGIIAMLVVFMLIHVPMAVYPEHFGVSWQLAWARIPIQFVLIAWAYWHTR